MRKRTIATVDMGMVLGATLLLVTAGFAQSNERATAEAAASAFLRAMDDDEPGAVYDRYAGPSLRQGVSKQVFSEQLGVLRIQWGGRARSRVLVGAQAFSQTPTGQTGRFFFLRYRSQFPSGISAFQDVTLEGVNEDWKVGGIYALPVPPGQ